MQVTNKIVKGMLLAMLATTAASANAANAVNVSFNFDNVSSGTTANSLLSNDVATSFMHFANSDYVTDSGYDDMDPTAPSHWVDASSGYGDVLVKNNAALFGNYAVSGQNVLWNDHAPILVLFNTAVNINSFSVQQDLSGFGNPQIGGSFLAFLDESGHVISGLNQYYTQTDATGQSASNAGRGLLLTANNVSNVHGILLNSGVNYDNFSINAVAVAAVPEPTTYAMMLAGLGLLGSVIRRRKNQ